MVTWRMARMRALVCSVLCLTSEKLTCVLQSRNGPFVSMCGWTVLAARDELQVTMVPVLLTVMLLSLIALLCYGITVNMLVRLGPTRARE